MSLAVHCQASLQVRSQPVLCVHLGSRGHFQAWGLCRRHSCCGGTPRQGLSHMHRRGLHLPWTDFSSASDSAGCHHPRSPAVSRLSVYTGMSSEASGWKDDWDCVANSSQTRCNGSSSSLWGSSSQAPSWHSSSSALSLGLFSWSRTPWRRHPLPEDKWFVLT